MNPLFQREKLTRLNAQEQKEYIDSCEQSQLSELLEISENILKRGVSLVALAGPSCSGKTTTAHRLIRSLSSSGKQVKVLSTDDFFFNVDTYPETPDGVPDFDHIDRLDVPLLSQVLRDISDGKTVSLPRFDFLTGKRKADVERYEPQENSLLILEGIHALNDCLFDSSMRYFRLGLNVVDPFVLDDEELFSAKEIRLIRRVIRDEKFRSYSAEQTLRIWNNVLRGEINFVVPFFEHTDFFLPTGLSYEPFIWRTDALDSFSIIQESSPFYEFSQSIVRRLKCLPTFERRLVPDDSILREFIGNEPQ